jgi:hypothetical protein
MARRASLPVYVGESSQLSARAASHLAAQLHLGGYEEAVKWLRQSVAAMPRRKAAKRATAMKPLVISSLFNPHDFKNGRVRRISKSSRLLMKTAEDVIALCADPTRWLSATPVLLLSVALGHPEIVSTRRSAMIRLAASNMSLAALMSRADTFGLGGHSGFAVSGMRFRQRPSFPADAIADRHRT